MFRDSATIARNVHSQVADRIGALIVRGDVLPGDPLPSEVKICEMLDVSRTVVREAIRTLTGKGLVESRALLSRPERHIRCNPVQAQFIVDERFPPVACEGAFDKRLLDREYVESQEELVTRGWRRLQEVAELKIPISEYPLPEVRQRRAPA